MPRGCRGGRWRSGVWIFFLCKVQARENPVAVGIGAFGRAGMKGPCGLFPSAEFLAQPCQKLRGIEAVGPRVSDTFERVERGAVPMRVDLKATDIEIRLARCAQLGDMGVQGRLGCMPMPAPLGMQGPGPRVAAPAAFNGGNSPEQFNGRAGSCGCLGDCRVAQRTVPQR